VLLLLLFWIISLATLSGIEGLKTELKFESENEPAFVPPKEVSVSYRRVSLEISFAVLKAFPRFVVWRPEAFQRFFMTIVRTELLEPISHPARSILVSDILVKGYFAAMAGSNDHEKWIKKAHAHIIELLKIKTDYGVFIRTAAARFSVIMGYISSKQADDKKWVWRQEFIDLLNQFCNDKDGEIQRLAWNTNVEQDITVTDYSSLVDKSLLYSKVDKTKTPQRRGRFNR